MQPNTEGCLKKPAPEYIRHEMKVMVHLLAQQSSKACSRDSAVAASGQASDCPCVAQSKATLKPHRTSVERPEEESSQMLPIQSDRV